MLADHVVAADGDSAPDGTIKTEVLGIRPEDRPVADLAAFAQGHTAHQLGMSADDATPANASARFHDRQGADLDVLADFCARIYNGGGVDFQKRQGCVGDDGGGNRRNALEVTEIRTTSQGKFI
jgi:hypothetical protein